MIRGVKNIIEEAAPELSGALVIAIRYSDHFLAYF